MHNILSKSCSSTTSQSSWNDGRSGWQSPHFLLRRRNALIRCSSRLLTNRDQELLAYIILATATDLKMMCSPLSLKPCARRIIRAYCVCAHDLMTSRICADIDRVFVIVTPSILSVVTSSISTIDGGGEPMVDTERVTTLKILKVCPVRALTF